MNLRDVSKVLYLEHGWEMPKGFIDSKERDPGNFDLAEWQQAKRAGRDPKALKAIIQECWASSPDCDSFSTALERRGLYLAKGDRRGFVAVTYEGEALPIGRSAGRTAKEVRAKLGQADDFRSVTETKAHIANVIAPKLKELIASADKARSIELQPLVERRHGMKLSHASERQRLDARQQERALMEARGRAARLRTGVMGLWDRFTGAHGATLRINDVEAYAAFRRDRGQRQELVDAQLKDRQALQAEIRTVRHRHATRVLDLHCDLARQNEGRESLRERFNDMSSPRRGEASHGANVLRGRRGQSRSGMDMGR